MSFDWLKAVFLYNCMENMETFTSLYAIAYAIMNSMENLRFGKEGYFHVLVFYTGYFIKEIENPCSHTLQKHSRKFGRTRRKNIRGSLGELDVKTFVEVWENSTWKHSPYGFAFPLQFLVLPKLPFVFLLLHGNTENVLYFLIITTSYPGSSLSSLSNGHSVDRAAHY